MERIFHQKSWAHMTFTQGMVVSVDLETSAKWFGVGYTLPGTMKSYRSKFQVSKFLPKELRMGSNMENLRLNYNITVWLTSCGSRMQFQMRQNESAACFRRRYIRHSSFPSGSFSLSYSLSTISGYLTGSQYSTSMYTSTRRAWGVFTCVHMHMAACTLRKYSPTETSTV